ncbi:hypothetical protein AMECASPLE_038976 [Ameca splendens]|uniref:Uncharacterized protein n=1 Tax=Ameca splendens TaxID=208324 RepID=A0ABV0Y917_9TELE
MSSQMEEEEQPLLWRKTQNRSWTADSQSEQLFSSLIRETGLSASDVLLSRTETNLMRQRSTPPYINLAKTPCGLVPL